MPAWSCPRIFDDRSRYLDRFGALLALTCAAVITLSLSGVTTATAGTKGPIATPNAGAPASQDAIERALEPTEHQTVAGEAESLEQRLESRLDGLDVRLARIEEQLHRVSRRPS